MITTCSCTSEKMKEHEALDDLLAKYHVYKYALGIQRVKCSKLLKLWCKDITFNLDGMGINVVCSKTDQ